MDHFDNVLAELCAQRRHRPCCARVHVSSVIRFAGRHVGPGHGVGAIVDLDRPDLARWVEANSDILHQRRRSTRHVVHQDPAGRQRYRVPFHQAPAAPGAPSLDRVFLDNPLRWQAGGPCCTRALWRAALLCRGRRRRQGSGGAIEVWCPDGPACGALVSAGAMMGVGVRRRQERHGQFVVVHRTAQVVELLLQLGAYRAAEDWPAVVPPQVEENSIARFNQARARDRSRALHHKLHRALDILGADAPAELVATARHRLAHPDMSLDALARRARPPRSASTLSRRLRRLILLADQHARRHGVADTDGDLSHTLPPTTPDRGGRP
ncbi:DNA-binding protein WhiA [Saccharothrix sp. NPDC042600]|uniref:DNA-binding protein WhiA n=1 Tax=Saccharothrix TaxID=2071 RepID=UPI0033BFF0A7|nr:hypothetical protein GCM10017745_49230 [Saccharothrix mutabilis subsp. capreolus]